MAWKPTGRPTVRQQRDKWVVRIDGIDTETGSRRPRQLGTFTSRRSAQAAATSFAAAGEVGGDRDTVGRLVDQWVAGRLDVSNKTRVQYEWAAGHIRPGIGGIRVDRLDREDVARWLEGLATTDSSHVGASRSSGWCSAPRSPMPSTSASSVAAQPRGSGCPVRWPSPAVSVRPRRGLRRRCSVPRGDQRASVGSPVATGRALRATPQRASRLALVRRRPEEAHGADRAGLGRGAWSAGVERRQERPLPAVGPDRSGDCEALNAHRRFQTEERLAAGPSWNEQISWWPPATATSSRQATLTRPWTAS